MPVVSRGEPACPAGELGGPGGSAESFAFAAWQEWPPLGLGVAGASGALWAGSLLTELGAETGHPQQPPLGPPLASPHPWGLASG